MAVGLAWPIVGGDSRTADVMLAVAPCDETDGSSPRIVHRWLESRAGTHEALGEARPVDRALNRLPRGCAERTPRRELHPARNLLDTGLADHEVLAAGVDRV